MIIDDEIKTFNCYFKFEKGKHKIIILFNNILIDCKGMFKNCNRIIELNIINFKTNKVKDMSEMFSNCSKLTNLNLSNFNTENVNNMNEIFYEFSDLIFSILNLK